MAQGGSEAVTINLDELCIDHDKNIIKGRSVGEAEGGSLMKNIGREFNDYFRTNVNMGSLTEYIFIRKAYKTVYEKIKTSIEDQNKKGTKGKKKFHICGTPMIGKTDFLFYVLTWLPVDFPELPGIATLGVFPGGSDSGDMEWFNDLKCMHETTGTGNEKKVSTTLKIAEVAHNRPTFHSKEIKEKYKYYIFLIDNAKKEYVYSLMNTCIVFASPKLEKSASINNVKTDTTTYWIPVWSPEEIIQFQHLVPEAFPAGENNDIVFLLRHFGGTIGNMTHRNRKSRFQHLKFRCSSAAASSVLATTICQDESDVIAEYSSLVENEVNEDYELAGTRYISSFVTKEIMGEITHRAKVNICTILGRLCSTGTWRIWQNLWKAPTFLHVKGWQSENSSCRIWGAEEWRLFQ